MARLTVDDMELFFVQCWAIWNQRNSVLYGGSIQDPSRLVRRAEDYLKEYRNAQDDLLVGLCLSGAEVGGTKWLDMGVGGAKWLNMGVAGTAWAGIMEVGGAELGNGKEIVMVWPARVSLLSLQQDRVEALNELSLVDPSSSTSTGAPAQAVVTHSHSSSISTMADAGKTDVQPGSGRNSSGQNTSSTYKSQSSHHKNTSAHPYSHSSGYSYQRGGVSQKNSSGT
nr:hypothetical protein CFP56_39306 [Quercus suber]